MENRIEKVALTIYVIAIKTMKLSLTVSIVIVIKFKLLMNLTVKVLCPSSILTHVFFVKLI